MHDVEDLVGEFAWVDVVAVRVVGDEGDVERADVWDEWQALEEVVLLFVSIRFIGHVAQDDGLPSLCSRWTPLAL